MGSSEKCGKKSLILTIVEKNVFSFRNLLGNNLLVCCPSRTEGEEVLD